MGELLSIKGRGWEIERESFRRCEGSSDSSNNHHPHHQHQHHRHQSYFHDNRSCLTVEYKSAAATHIKKTHNKWSEEEINYSVYSTRMLVMGSKWSSSRMSMIWWVNSHCDDTSWSFIQVVVSGLIFEETFLYFVWILFVKSLKLQSILLAAPRWALRTGKAVINQWTNGYMWG